MTADNPQVDPEIEAAIERALEAAQLRAGDATASVIHLDSGETAVGDADGD